MIASWFAPEWLVRPMHIALQWFLDITGNYGIAIILLTILVRAVILPLTVYQMKSMKKMQEIQPLIKELQEKYKDQPEKLNQEMMQVYRTQGVNPFAGCLPLLIQMPFLYAIFGVLHSFNPAPHSPGFLWIPDLNAKDPYLILPILTVVSMLAQSWLTGAGQDPNQRVMMYMMPILFGYISYTMPQSGVVLYWVVSTLFGLAQQAVYPGFPRFKPAAATVTAAPAPTAARSPGSKGETRKK